MVKILQQCEVRATNGSGNPVVLYLGYDSGEAEAAFRGAGPEYSDVSIFPKGTQPRNTRYPTNERNYALAQIQAQKDHTEAALKKNKTLAEAKLEQARKLTAEAEALQETILKTAHIISPEATLAAPKKSKK